MFENMHAINKGIASIDSLDIHTSLFNQFQKKIILKIPPQGFFGLKKILPKILLTLSNIILAFIFIFIPPPP